MHIGGFLQTNIISRADQYEVFVLLVYLLQFPDGFQSYIVMPCFSFLKMRWASIAIFICRYFIKLESSSS